jgi:hypothetical protein
MRENQESLPVTGVPAARQPPAQTHLPVSWERMIRAVEKVRESLLRAVAALETAGVPYAVKDRTHLRDLIGVGLLDASWISRLPAELAPRLQSLLDNTEG